jgi:hypothetical protein
MSYSIPGYINGFGINNPLKDVYECDYCGAKLIWDNNEGKCYVRGGDAECVHGSEEMDAEWARRQG